MKQNKSILFLTRLYHPHIGGVEKHVQLLSEALVDRGLTVTIITEQFDKKLPLIESLKNCTVYRIPIGKNEFLKKFLIWKWMFLHLSLLLKCEVIHIHDVFYWILPIRPLLLHKKIFITFHGYEGYPVKQSWIWQRKIGEKLSSGTICVGDFMKKWYFASPASVIYGAVKLNTAKYKEKDQSAVFFGRLDSQTGILEYVKAYKIIKKQFPNFTLTVVGEGEYTKKIPYDIKKVDFVGDVSQYIGKNRFIFVSRYLSILEALVQNKEVISVYNSPIMKDYLLMSPFKKFISVCTSSEEIADVVIKRLKMKHDPLKMNEGYAWAKNQTWEKLVSVYLRLWE